MAGRAAATDARARRIRGFLVLFRFGQRPAAARGRHAARGSSARRALAHPCTEGGLESHRYDLTSLELHQGLNSTRRKLRRAALEVRQTMDGAKVASREIADGKTDLSTHPETQASTLRQTSSAIPQFAATAYSNAQRTQEAREVVADVAAQSSAVASLGAQTRQQVVERTSEIHAGASRIAQIVGLIDGIAFQTAVLALNAAVEAARAGEHGRGFAVVASAQRNAEFIPRCRLKRRPPRPGWHAAKQAAFGCPGGWRCRVACPDAGRPRMRASRASRGRAGS